MKDAFRTHALDAYWSGAVRLLLRTTQPCSTEGRRRARHYRRALEHASRSAGAASVGAGVTLLPEPDRAAQSATRSSPPTTTSSSRPTCSRAGSRPSSPTRRRGSSRPTTARECWLYDGELIPNVGFNAVAGPTGQRVRLRARPASTRCVAGAWDIDARVDDMDLNGVYASSVFPSFLPGFAGQRLQLAPTDPRARPRRGAGVERLASRGVGGRPSRPHHPLPAPVAARPRPRGRGDPAQRRPRLQGGHLLRGPAQARAALASTPATGTRSSPPARRPSTVVYLHVGSSGDVAVHHRRRAAGRRSACCSSATRCSPRSTGSTRRIPVGSRT